jgi:hypothetical protein
LTTTGSQPDVNNIVDITLHKENNPHVIKQRLKDILMKSKIRDYVAVTDTEEKNKIVIVKKDHAEQLGPSRLYKNQNTLSWVLLRGNKCKLCI